MKPKNDGLGFVMKDYVITLKLFTVAGYCYIYMEGKDANYGLKLEKL